MALGLKKTDLLRSRWSSVHLKGATGWKVDGMKTMLPPFHLERNVDVATHAHSQRDPSPTPYTSLLAPIASVAPPATVTIAGATCPIASMEPPLPSPLMLRSVLIASMVPPPLYPLPIGARTYCQLPVWHLPLHMPINSAAPALLLLLQCAFIASMGPPHRCHRRTHTSPLPLSSSLQSPSPCTPIASTAPPLPSLLQCICSSQAWRLPRYCCRHAWCPLLLLMLCAILASCEQIFK